MDILGFLSNEIVQQVGSALFGLFVGGVGVWLWINSGLSKAITTGGEYAGNVVGLFLWNNVVGKIKDENLRKKVIEDLDTAGNDFDKGWDKGINGIKV